MGQCVSYRRPRPCDRTPTGAARPNGNDAARPAGLVVALHNLDAFDHGQHRLAPRRSPRHGALSRRPVGISRAAWHVLGVARHDRLGWRDDQRARHQVSRQCVDLRGIEDRTCGTAQRDGNGVRIIAVRAQRLAGAWRRTGRRWLRLASPRTAPRPRLPLAAARRRVGTRPRQSPASPPA